MGAGRAAPPSRERVCGQGVKTSAAQRRHGLERAAGPADGVPSVREGIALNRAVESTAGPWPHESRTTDQRTHSQ